MLSRCARRGGNDSGYTASPNKKLSVKAETFLKSPENLCEFVGVHVGIRCPDYKRKRVPQSVIHSTAPRLAPPETVPAVPGGGRQIEVCAHLILRQKFLECPQAIRN